MQCGNALATQTVTAVTERKPGHNNFGTSSVLILDPAMKKPGDYWQKAVARFRTLETTAPKQGIVLFGDSITARWPEGLFPGKDVNNRGIGGDHIGGWNYFGLLDRLDTSIAALQPRKIYLMIGVNDMLPGGPPMDNMITAYGYLLHELKELAPGAEVVVHSILPVSKPEFSYMHEPIKELNSYIKKLAAFRGMKYVDLYSRFADEQGLLKKELTNDGVHLTPAGYELWRKVLIEEGLAEE